MWILLRPAKIGDRAKQLWKWSQWSLQFARKHISMWMYLEQAHLDLRFELKKCWFHCLVARDNAFELGSRPWHRNLRSHTTHHFSVSQPECFKNGDGGFLRAGSEWKWTCTVVLFFKAEYLGQTNPPPSLHGSMIAISGQLQFSGPGQKLII